MQIFFFRSASKPAVYGLTPRSDGADLPTQFAPWEEAGSVTNEMAMNAEVRAALQRDGYYLACPA